MYTWRGLILALVAPLSFVMGLLCVPIDGNMCSAFVSSDGAENKPSVLRDKLITAFKTNCRPINICSFNTEPSDPIRYTDLYEPFKMPFWVNFSVKAEKDARIALSGNGTDESIFTEICIGCGFGDEAFIRACHPYTCFSRLQTHVDNYLLDPNEYRSFWIEYEMGIVRVGKGGVYDAMVEWDAGAYHGRVPTEAYVIVSTGSDNYGSWIFC